jgi:hypothetical protein
MINYIQRLGMTDKHNEIVIEKSPDYGVAYADNVILQVGSQMSRLIFYQDTIELNADSTSIDIYKKCKQI